MITRFLKKNSHVNWVLADQGMVSGVNFLTNILFARFLGIEEFGRFTLVWMAVLFVNSIQMAIISAPMMSIGPKQTEEKIAVYYGAVAIQQMYFACISFALIFAGVKLSGLFYPEWHVRHLALPLAFVVLFFQTQDFLRRFFFSNGQHHIAFANDAISYLGQLGLLLSLFLSTKLNTAAVLWVIASTSAIAVFVGSFYFGQLSWRQGILVKIFLRHWHFSKWLAASAGLQWISGNLFMIVSGALLGPIAVGAIKAAQNIVGIINPLMMSMENFLPRDAAIVYAEGDAIKLFNYIKAVCIKWGIILLMILTVVIVFSKWLMLFVYGKEYFTYAYVLRIAALTIFIGFLGTPIGIALRTVEKTKIIFTSFIKSSLLTVILVYPIVLIFGLAGAMIGIFFVKLILIINLYLGLIRYVKNKGIIGI